MTKLTRREFKIVAQMASNLIASIRSDTVMNKLDLTEDEIILVYLKIRGADSKITDPIAEKIASKFAAKAVNKELNRIFCGIRHEKN